MIALEDVAELIRQELRGELPQGVTLDADTRLDDLGLSSLQISDIVFTLEEQHEFEFDAARAADVKVLGELVALANEAIGGESGQPDLASGQPDLASGQPDVGSTADAVSGESR
jgi:acyl carrier protein